MFFERSFDPLGEVLSNHLVVAMDHFFSFFNFDPIQSAQ